MVSQNIRGERGGLFINSAAAFVAATAKNNLLGAVCMTDTVLSAITMSGFAGTESKLIGETLVAGTYIPGWISAMTVTSGLVEGNYA